MPRVGQLFYDYYEERYAIKYATEDFSYLFHCGDCLQVFDGKVWLDTRFESNDAGWYLVGVNPELEITRLKARLY